MKAISILLMLTCLVFLNGCVPLAVGYLMIDKMAEPTLPRAKANLQIVHLPRIGMIAEAEIGQTLVSKAYLESYPAVRLTKDVADVLKQSSSRSPGTIRLSAGLLTKRNENSEGSFYSSSNGFYETSNERTNYPVGLFIPKDKMKPSVLYVYYQVMGAAGYEFGTLPIDYTETTQEVWSQDGYKRELIYGGLSQKTISVSYREFVDNLARPAFTQEIKYDLNNGDVIGFRGARFQILEATNTKIRYKVLKELD